MFFLGHDMTNTQMPIAHNFQSGSINNAGLMEKLGMLALRTAGWMTRPVEYVGFSKAAGLVRAFVPSKRKVRTQLFEDTNFEYPYADSYWSRLVYSGDVYSRAEENFLKAIRHIDYAYIDCGANFGYMSAVVTSKAYGQKPAIAIEADPMTFKALEINADLNNNRFEIRHNAVFSASGEMVNIHGEKHEARSMLNDHGDREKGNVETLALDDLTNWYTAQSAEALILKLDVEGVEIDALKGSTELLKLNTLIMFEDHASDKTHEVSEYLMKTLGMRIYYSEKNGCRELKTIEDVAKLKTNPRVGYDFIATKSDFWIKEIEACKYP